MSLTRPARTNTTECSCKLWPSPGMYAVISCPLVNRTRAILRIAELGLRGVVVVTLVHTPRLKGDGYNTGRFLSVLKPRARAGAFDFLVNCLRPLRTSCDMRAMICK